MSVSVFYLAVDDVLTLGCWDPCLVVDDVSCCYLLELIWWTTYSFIFLVTVVDNLNLLYCVKGFCPIMDARWQSVHSGFPVT